MDLFREYIKLIVEDSRDSSLEMKPIDDLALIIDGARHATTFILYNPRYYAQKMKQDVSKAFEDFRKIKLKGELNDFRNFYSFSNVQDIFVDTNGVFGYMNINMGRMVGLDGGCYDANEIRSVAARKGYGLIMYLIALSIESPIMPNRDKVSDTAKEFWSYFDTERNKISTERFTDEESLHKKTEKDCKIYKDKVLDQSYSLKKPINLKDAVIRHKAFLEQMQNYFKENQIDFIKSRVAEYLLSAGKLFFETTEYSD